MQDTKSIRDELAETVKDVICEYVKLQIYDNYFHQISPEKIRQELGFVAQHSIREAVVDLVEAFEKGKLPNSLTHERYFNIKRMQSLNLV